MGFALQLLLDDEAQGRCLHTPHRAPGRGGVAFRDLTCAPTNRAVDKVADERGIHQRLINLAWRGHRGKHGRLCNFLEGHAVAGADLFEQLFEVPSDALALPIGVGS